ncbi:hypothetical protein SLA2020_509590 [Shorea laevis]
MKNEIDYLQASLILLLAETGEAMMLQRTSNACVVHACTAPLIPHPLMFLLPCISTEDAVQRWCLSFSGCTLVEILSFITFQAEAATLKALACSISDYIDAEGKNTFCQSHMSCADLAVKTPSLSCVPNLPPFLHGIA